MVFAGSTAFVDDSVPSYLIEIRKESDVPEVSEETESGVPALTRLPMVLKGLYVNTEVSVPPVQTPVVGVQAPPTHSSRAT